MVINISFDLSDKKWKTKVACLFPPMSLVILCPKNCFQVQYIQRVGLPHSFGKRQLLITRRNLFTDMWRPEASQRRRSVH